eukprot:TRINITY_DN11922_c0_g1_i2.p1 TRINITY_DN11922_c0_g1~~TRINITY_DN11922_c0_g1_i2.p1  ORF type:complete len:443 (-),score=45.40 TRINITY_DN11922_c0_g1_i2:41-1297(-)
MDGSVIYQQLNDLFDQDPDIDELGLLVSIPENESGESNELFLLKDHKLGIAFGCIPLVYSHAHALFLPLRQKVMNMGVSSCSLSEISDLVRSTRSMLLINADNYTAWNIRKQIIEAGHQTELQEIKFLNLVFTKHPKSGEGWAHRRWLLRRIPGFSSSPSPARASAELRESLLEGELRVCERVAEIYPKNYFAWSHRHWLVQSIMERRLEIFQQELERLKRWSNLHVSDHSGFHHRQVTLLELLELCPVHNSLARVPFHHRQAPHLPRPSESKCHACSLWRQEFDYLNVLLDHYPGHESIWHHRRFVYTYWIRFQAQHHASQYDQTWLWSQSEKELNFAQQQANDDGVERYLDNRRFALAYLMWVAERTLELAQLLSFTEDDSFNLIKQQYEAILRFMPDVWPFQQKCFIERSSQLNK